MLHLPKLLFLLMAISMLSCGKNKRNSIPCIPSNVSNHVIAFYSFSNGSLADVSGNTQDLINTTSAHSTSDRNGNANCAYQFNNIDSTEEFLTTSSTSFLDGLDEFSISFWYMPLDTTREDGAYEGMVSRGNVGACPDRMGEWSVGLYDCRKAVFGRTNSVWDQNITNFDCLQEINIRTNNWSHVVATYDESGVKMKIYRNGVLQDYSSGSTNCTSGVPTYQDMGDLFIGFGFTGIIDDLIIFDEALTHQEVNDLYNMDTCCELPDS